MTTTITPFEIEALRCASIDTGATGFDELADRIEAMQAENAALKAENAELQKQLDMLKTDAMTGVRMWR